MRSMGAMRTVITGKRVLSSPIFVISLLRNTKNWNWSFGYFVISSLKAFLISNVQFPDSKCFMSSGVKHVGNRDFHTVGGSDG